MKQGWEIKRLDDLCQIKTGKKDVNQGNLNGKYPFFTCAREHTFSDSYSFDTEALLIAGNGDVGKVSYYNGKFEAYQRTYVLFDFVNILPRFLFLILDGTLKKSMANQKLGNTMPYIKLGMLKEFEIPLPSLLEQERLVAILDEALTAIAKAKANAEQNLKNSKELFESYLQGVFENKGEDWEEKTLGEVANHSLGKMLDKNKNKGLPQKYLRNQSVRWFEFDLSDLTEMPFLESEKEKYTAIKGDVLICEGGYPGRAAIWQENYPIYFQKAIHRVRFNKKEYNEWFLYYLFILDRTDKLKTHFTGTGIQHFTGQALDKLIIPLPPINKVSNIIQKLDALSTETQKLEAVYTQKISDLEEFKKSILQKAFSGELKTEKLCV